MTEPKPPQAAEPLSRRTIAFSFVGALAFLYLRTFLLPATPFIAMNDQSLFFARAARMVHGQVLYRDFFEIVTPGTDLLYAGAFRLFGIHAWVMQAWAIGVGLALSVVITLIARRILRGPTVLLPALLFLIFDFNSGLDLTHHWYSTLAALAAIAVLVGGTGPRRIFAASSFCGFATLFTQTQGTFTFIAVAVYLLWLKRSKAQESSLLALLAVLLLPFTLIVSGVLGYYIHQAGFHPVFFDLVIFPLKFLSSVAANQPQTYLKQIPPVHKLADSIHLIPMLFIYALVPYIYFFGVYRLWRERKILPDTRLHSLVLLHLVGLALFAAIVNGPRYFRICTVAPPAILICTWLLSQQGSAQRLIRNLLWLLAAAFALMLPFRRQMEWHATLDLPIGRTAFSDVLLYREFQWLAPRTHPSESFFNSSVLSLYLSLDNPTPSEFVTYDESFRPEMVTAIVRAFRHSPPDFVVVLPENTIANAVHDHAAPFRQYVHDNYHLVRVFDLDHSLYKQELWEDKFNSNK